MADKNFHVGAIYIYSHWDDSVPPGSVELGHRFATSRLLTPSPTRLPGSVKTSMLPPQRLGLPKISFAPGAEAIGRSCSYFTYLSYWGASVLLHIRQHAHLHLRAKRLHMA